MGSDTLARPTPMVKLTPIVATISTIGEGRDLRGGAGDDSLTGDARANTLIGGLGVDELFGLAGKDRLKALDGLADGTMDCGPGRDLASLDPLDPPPISC